MLGALEAPPPTGPLRVDSGHKPRLSNPDSTRQSPPGQCPDLPKAYQHCRLWPASMVPRSAAWSTIRYRPAALQSSGVGGAG